MSISKTTSSSSSSSSSKAKAWVVHGLLAGAAIAVAFGARAYHLGRSGWFGSRVIGIIPARFASSRFQGKPLVHILGKPMIQVVTFTSVFRCSPIFHLIFWRKNLFRERGLLLSHICLSCCACKGDTFCSDLIVGLVDR